MNIENIGILGHLEVEEVCKETGHTQLVVDERNVIVTTGFQTFLGGITNEDQYQFGFDGIYLGNDVGNGTLEDPEPATKFTSSLDQNIVHRVDDDSVWTSYPAFNKLRFTSVVDGHEIFLNTGEPRNVFTSASIRNKRNEVVAYKRFAGRVTSPMLSLNIRWTLTVVDQCLDIPTRFVTNVLFYVMQEWEEQPNTDILHPEELSMGTGVYTREITLDENQREVYVIALQEWDNGTITAIEWDGTTPTTPNTMATFDSTSATLTQESPYVMKIRMKTDKILNTLKICSEGVCDILSVRNTTIYPQTWDGMIPLGEPNEEDWPLARYWKLANISGSFLGASGIGLMLDPSPHVWQYWMSGDQVVLHNTITGQTEYRATGGLVRHLHVSMDNSHKPIMVWQSGRDVYINAWDETTVDYKTTKHDGYISPVVVSPSIIPNLSHTAPQVATVRHSDGLIVLIDPVTRNAVETTVGAVDILSCGSTPQNSQKLVYVTRNAGIPTIRNIATPRTGGYVGSGLLGSSTSVTIHQVGLINNTVTFGD